MHFHVHESSFINSSCGLFLSRDMKTSTLSVEKCFLTIRRNLVFYYYCTRAQGKRHDCDRRLPGLGVEAASLISSQLLQHIFFCISDDLSCTAAVVWLVLVFCFLFFVCYCSDLWIISRCVYSITSNQLKQAALIFPEVLLPSHYCFAHYSNVPYEWGDCTNKVQRKCNVDETAPVTQ